MVENQNVRNSLELIRSSSVKTRQEGLANLKTLFRDHGRNFKLENVFDQGYHVIFEAIFACTWIERSTFLKAARGVVKNNAASRLSACAATLRTVVEVGVQNLQIKSVDALIEHVTQALELPDHGMCEPLIDDYSKTLRAIVHWQPHVEHMHPRGKTQGKWQDLAKFCLDTIKIYTETFDQTASITSNGHSAANTPSYSSGRLVRSFSSQVGNRGTATANPCAEFIVCIRKLVEAPNAPVVVHGPEILDGLTEFLRSSTTIGRGHLDAFAAINLVISRLVNHSGDVVKDQARKLVPIIRNSWSNKRASLKEELLTSLILLKPYIFALARDGEDMLIKDDVESLLETLANEYARRQEKELLQIDDLVFLGPNFRAKPPNSDFKSTFKLKTSHESQYMMVYVMASLSAALDMTKREQAMSSDMEWDGQGPNKRRCTSDSLSDISRRLLFGTTLERLCALQSVSFLVGMMPVDISTLSSAITRMVSLLGDSHPSISSWAMVCLSNCSLHPEASHSSLKESWATVWHATVRCIPNVPTSRAASHLLGNLLRLGIVDYTSISSTVDAIFSAVEVNGPAILCDSSLSLWTMLMNKRLAENPSSNHVVVSRILQWILSKWTPSEQGRKPMPFDSLLTYLDKFLDRTYAMHDLQNYSIEDLSAAISACLGSKGAVGAVESYSIAGPLSRTLLGTEQNRSLSEYLLLFSDRLKLRKNENGPDPCAVSTVATASRSFESSTLVITFCLSETERMIESWSSLTTDRQQPPTLDMLRIATATCIINSLLIWQKSNKSDSRQTSLGKANESLIRSLTSYLSKPECDQQKVDAVLAVVSRVLPDPAKLQSLQPDQFAECGILPMALHLSNALIERRSLQESLYINDTNDLMDVDDEFESQDSRNRPTVASPDNPRDLLSADHDIVTFRACTASYLFLISAAIEASTVDDARNGVPRPFFEHMESLSEVDFCACRPLISAVLSSKLQIQWEDARLVLEHLAIGFLEIYEHERNEVVLNFCIDLAIGFASKWVDDEAGSDNIGYQVYHHMVKLVRRPGVVSAGVQIRAADLFYHLDQLQTDFPSARESLLYLMRTSSVPVQYHVAKLIADIFGHSVLSEHEELFERVHQSLPNEAMESEGIAMRLFALSQLASEWQTVLRRCVYHIFETVAMLPSAAGHAAMCVSMIAQSLNLNSAQSLFRLFASQILFTWGETESLHDLPFKVFRYESLKALIVDIQDELVAQSIMRGRDEDLKALSEICGIPIKDLVRLSFGKSAAYCFAWDLCHTTPQSDPTKSSEQYLRSLAGKDRYGDMLRQRIHEVLAVFLCTASDADNIEKIFARKWSADTAKLLEEMKNFSHSDAQLPPPLQPAFPAKFLPHLFERLAKRASMDPQALWTAPNFVFVMRALLGCMSPALGSLNACVSLRRIRIAIASAGDIATAGYPLEMCIHAFRPYLTDQHCAEDAIGIVQYLYTKGKKHLQSNLGFVAGSAVMTLLSGRVFLHSSQDQTTQDSQHRATMKTAETFRNWFSSYLDTLVLKDEQTAVSERFNALLKCATQSHSESTALAGSPEANLLVQLFSDDLNEPSILSESMRGLILRTVQQSFSTPPALRDDVLLSDANACRYAQQIWRSSNPPVPASNYSLWIARTLGRAFNSKSGSQSFALQIVSKPNSTRQFGHFLDDNDPLTAIKKSRASIVRRVYVLLQSNSQTEVRSAEETLRACLERSFNKDSLSYESISLVVPQDVQGALYLPQNSKGGSVFRDASLAACSDTERSQDFTSWLRDLTMALIYATPKDPILGCLGSFLYDAPNVAEQIFAQVLHIALVLDFHRDQSLRAKMSQLYHEWLSKIEHASRQKVKLLLNGLLYLRGQPYVLESTSKDRDRWLEIDHLTVSRAACNCGMYTAALVYAETCPREAQRQSRRSSILQSVDLPVDLMTDIYENLPEPDSFYGVQTDEGLHSALTRFDYEQDGYKSLLFRGAKLDSQLRGGGDMIAGDISGLTKSLMDLNLNSLTQIVLSDAKLHNSEGHLVDSALTAARKLEQWDLKTSEDQGTESSVVFGALQAINNVTDATQIREGLHSGFLNSLKMAKAANANPMVMHEGFRAMAILSEIDEILSSQSVPMLGETLAKIQSRHNLLDDARFEDIQPILSARQTLLSVLCRSETLQIHLHASPRDLRRFEVQNLLSASALAREYDAQKENLSAATYLQDLVHRCREIGLNIESIAKYEAAKVLWDQQEPQSSIRMLQKLSENEDLEREDFPPGRGMIMANLARQVAKARLEKPQAILENYLKPAVAELKNNKLGAEASDVFHEFASFCDAQLQNSDSREEFLRTQKTRDRRKAEMEAYPDVARKLTSRTEKAKLSRAFEKAKLWFSLEDDEYKRLHTERETFLKMSIQNYLQSLAASDQHDDNILRLVALWLEFADSSIANSVVEDFLPPVSSRKFVGLITQLSSRLQSDDTLFQKLLANLVFRICRDHPYHGLYQLYSNTTQPRLQDEAAKSRQSAAIRISNRLKADKKSEPYWAKVKQAHDLYEQVAMYRDKREFNAGNEYDINHFPATSQMAKRVPKLAIPPSTMTVALRSDGNYKDVPTIVRFGSRMKIAGGVSAPKIINVIATDSKRYHHLLKGGTDDLRQDAIMEQVFEQVSGLLGKHPKTRQRSLQIRTYKVIPLSSISGIIEFVRDTVPLQDVLIPMHEKYHLKDIKAHNARSKIGHAAEESTSVRLKTYQEVCARFNPAMRFWFLEKFLDPDEWFEKRLAYTRSLAANSILGYIVGLGDRHLHNILVDSGTGEVVHIDLGIAFEAGRVLRVPEIVPFRLTRDLVDGMGYTKTEGVFRRCCEFTMDALRAERVSIMTLLNVLRYDPLCTWTVSPLKARKIQDEEEDEQGEGLDEIAGHASRSDEDDIGEASRALSIVEKKLSTTLSTTATVNELIQQATDERNLALMFSGWAAYA